MAIRKVGEYVRPTWAERWMKEVDVAAKMSVCLFYQIGCRFVEGNNKYGLVSGHNGPPKNHSHCNEVGCSKLDKKGNMLPPNSGRCIGCHAERNAIDYAASRGIAIKNSIVYCTFSPCWDCAKELVNIPIIQFIYKDKYKTDFEKVEKLFQGHGIELTKFRG